MRDGRLASVQYIGNFGGISLPRNRFFPSGRQKNLKCECFPNLDFIFFVLKAVASQFLKAPLPLSFPLYSRK